MASVAAAPDAHRKTSEALPLDIRATAFQRRVWTALQRIPFGETRSYSEVAKGDREADGGASGSACMRNEPGGGGDPVSPSGA